LSISCFDTLIHYIIIGLTQLKLSTMNKQDILYIRVLRMPKDLPKIIAL